MYIKSERFIITDLTMDMCNDYQKNSVDGDNRRFVPDEVCETLEDAEKTLKWLIGLYSTSNGPFVYPIITSENINIGYVQACPLGEDFEIGYHIAQKYTGNGFATEAVKIFPAVRLGIEDRLDFKCGRRTLYGIQKWKIIYNHMATQIKPLILHTCGLNKEI